MDPFTQKILEKAEQRSKIHGISKAPKLPLNEFEQLESSSGNCTMKDKKLNNSGSPSKIRRQYSVDKENVDVGIEINITTRPNVEVQVDFEEQMQNSSEYATEKEIVTENPTKLRDTSRNRLQRLGALYSNADNLSSPIHRTENKFYEENSESNESDLKRPRQRIGKLAALADSIKNWEDDTSHPDYRHENKHLDNKEQHYTSDSDEKQPTSSKNTKQLKWDKSVIDSLQAQGFQRRESSAKLCYDYGNKEITEHTVQIHNHDKASTTTKVTETNSQSSTENLAPEIKTGLVSSKTAMFENKVTKSPLKQKDPAEMPLKERMMLFEKNKGKAPLPKNNFLLPRTPMPVKTKIETKKSETNSRTELKDFPVGDVKVKDKVAALLSGPSTISETQIKANRTKQLQEDMNVLANRFHSRKDLTTDIQQSSQEKKSSNLIVPPPPPPMPLFDPNVNTIRNEHVDAKCMINNKRRSPGTNSEKTDSINKSSDDAKRIKVNSNIKKRSDRLYPVLSDLESIESDNGNCTTATMSTPSIENKSLDDRDSVSDEESESYMESDKDDGPYNVSLGREIMHIVHSNNLQGRKVTNMENIDSNNGFEYGGESSINNSSVTTSIESEAGIDDYLDEALEEDEDSDDGDNNYENRNKSNGTTSSNSFCYQKRPKKNVQYKTISEESENESNDVEQHSPHYKRGPLKSELTINSDESNIVTLVHTVSFYRRQQSNSNNSTPVKKIYRDHVAHENKNLEEHDIEDNLKYDSSSSDREEQHLVQEKIKRLLDEVCKQQQIIAQTSQALNLCASTVEFSGSTEAVEGERHLLVATHRRQAALDEIQRLKVEGTLRPIGAPKEKGRLSVKEITVPLKDDYIKKLSVDTISGHHLVCLLKYGEIVLATKTVPTLPGLLSVKFPDVLTFNNVYADFKITLEIYGMTAQREILPHEVKYHINLNSKKFGQKTPKKKGNADSMLIMPRIQSPAGPHVVRTPALVQYGFAIFSLREIQRDTWTLTQTSGVSPLKGIVQMKINCELSVNIAYKGFLTMFEDISGFGAWHRRWCYLNGNVLNYWKYPDDEKKKAPMGSIDLYTCCSSKVTSAPRDICARLNTLLLECQRPAFDTDTESLLIIPKGKITIVRYLLSADTKEERDEWCAYFNKTLTLLRAWNTSTQ